MMDDDESDGDNNEKVDVNDDANEYDNGIQSPFWSSRHRQLGKVQC